MSAPSSICSSGADRSTGSRSKRSYRNVYDLLDRLCKAQLQLPQQQRDALRNVTQFISNCPTALGSTLPYDDNTLVAKISQQLDKQQYNYTQSIEQEIGDQANLIPKISNAMVFVKLHEELKFTRLDPHTCSALLTFLYYLADSRYNMENSYNHHHQNMKNAYQQCLPPNGSQSPTGSSHMPSLRQSFGQPSSLFGEESNSNNFAGYNLTKSRGGTTIHLNSTYDITAKLAAFRNATSNSRLCTNVEGEQNVVVVSSNGRLNEPTKSHRKTQKHQQQEQHQQHQYQPQEEDIGCLQDEIIQNVIYSFTGIEGRYLKKDVISGKFKLDVNNSRSLTVVQAAMMLRLSELGYFHDQVQSYTDSRSGTCPLGLMGQGFVSALKHDLTKFYGMVAMLQEQLNKQRNHCQQQQQQQFFTASMDTPRQENLTLMKLLLWSVDPLQRLQWLVKISEACQEKKGGALASTVHGFLCNGNPLVKSLAHELLLAVCGPLYQMLTRWLVDGEICDPYAEFFIECLSEVGPDRLWHDKYRVRITMLPTFISMELAHKILITGKSVSFLCEICEDKQPVKGRDELRECIEKDAQHIFSGVADTKLHSAIDAIYLNTSKHVLDIAIGPHKLLEHLHAMRRYLLLGQGDFVGILMENLKSELDKPAKELYSYDLSSIMDTAIRSTNAQYDDPEILNHLDVRLLTPCAGDHGWDIVSLQYTVSGPLATMLEPSMGVYQVLFKPLWRMKHMEFVLSAKIWKDQTCNTKLLRPLAAELENIIGRLHLFTSQMIHFIHQMQYYILFEVIECSWVEFLNRIRDANTLDDILYFHDEFLSAIRIGAFLDPTSRELSLNMETVYDAIAALESWQDQFYELCFKELDARKQYDVEIVTSEAEGSFGVTNPKEMARDAERDLYEKSLKDCYKSLENIGADYEKAVRAFLFTLNSNNDHNLQLFGIRLDFNEYYKKRDQRLGVPLTFEHMRQSNVYFSTIANRSMHGSRYSNVN